MHPVIKMVIMTIAAAFVLKGANAQSFRSLKGRVLTPEQRPAEAATIQLLADSNLSQTTKANDDGWFSFSPVSEGHYQVLITMTGYRLLKVSVTITASSDSLIAIDPVILTPVTNTLAEVRISAKKTFIEHKLDKTVVNPGALITGAGLNALEILERTPGVVVDGNGSVSYMGKTGVLILIDGKPTYLSGEQLANYLKSLPASALDQIELMANPPARYEAAGTAGVINIHTKKTRTKGWNGSVVTSTGMSRMPRGSAGMNLNYYKGKVNIFGNLGYSYTKSKSILNLEREYFDAAGQLTSHYSQEAFSRPVNKTANLKLGLDYLVSPKTTVGMVLSGSFSPGNYTNPVSASLFNARDNLDSMIRTVNTSTSRFNNHAVNFNFLQKLDSTGSTLSADVDLVNYNSLNEQGFSNDILNANGSLKSRELTTADLPSGIRIRTAKVDMSKVIKRYLRMEVGGKISFVGAGNQARYFTWINNVPQIDERNTNQFDYREHIHAVYGSFTREGKRFSFQGGIRVENTSLNGLQSGNPVKPDSSFKHSYTNYFPTAYLSYKLDSTGKHILAASFGRRIDRPYYKDLNPFIYIVDKYTYFAGNPFLEPQFSNNYSVTYRYRNVFSTSLFSNRYTKYQTEAVYQQDGIFISRPSNIGKRIYQGINATISVRPARWWNLNLYSEVVNMKFSGQLNTANINTSSTYFYIEVGNQLDLSKDWSVEWSGFYITRRTAAQFELNAKEQLNFGLQKRFWNNKASLRCSVSDIFRTNLSTGAVTNVSGARSFYRNDLDTRMINLGFSYNFGNAGSTPKRRTTGSSQSEQSRIKN